MRSSGWGDLGREREGETNAALGGRRWTLVENALIVDKCSLQELPPILRVYEGCARALLGEIEEANLIKLHRFSGKVTYLVCDPAEGTGGTEGVEEMGYGHCRRRIKVNLRTLEIGFFEYDGYGCTYDPST